MTLLLLLICGPDLDAASASLSAFKRTVEADLSALTQRSMVNDETTQSASSR